MRVRTSRGLKLQAFHGNFFVRSTDLLALPAVPIDQSYCIELAIEDPLTQPFVVLQTAVLNTSASGASTNVIRLSGILIFRDRRTTHTSNHHRPSCYKQHLRNLWFGRPDRHCDCVGEQSRRAFYGLKDGRCQRCGHQQGRRHLRHLQSYHDRLRKRAFSSISSCR